MDNKDLSNLSDDSIAETVTKLIKDKIALENEKELQEDLAIIDEDIAILSKKIENKVYKITESNKFTDKDIIRVNLANDYILVDGLSFISDKECQEIASFLGYQHYKISNNYYVMLSIYFYNKKEALHE